MTAPGPAVPAVGPHTGSTATVKLGAHVAVVQGVVGSVMMLLGSLGTGWIATGSPMVRHPLVIELRVNPWGVYTCTVLLTLGAMLLIRSWLRLGQRLRGWPPGSLKTVTTAVLAWSVPLFFCVPIYSRDVYAYIGQGRLMLAGKDPYVEGISSLDNWFMLGADPEWAQARTPYGPYFLWIAAAVVRLTDAQPDLSVMLFRLAAYVGVVLCMVYVPKLARLHGVNGARALWIAVANPLFLISFVASAHNDALMVGLAVAGVYAAARKHPLLGILLVTGSIGIKPITILLLPFIGLLWAGKDVSWLRRFVIWAATALISFGLLALSGAVDGLGLGWAWALLDPTPGYTGYSPSGSSASRWSAWVTPSASTVAGSPEGSAGCSRAARSCWCSCSCSWAETARSCAAWPWPSPPWCCCPPSSSPGTSCGCCPCSPPPASRTTGRSASSTW